MKNVEWTINHYSPDGDIVDRGIFVYIDYNTIIRFETLNELFYFVHDVKKIANGIEEMLEED